MGACTINAALPSEGADAVQDVKENRPPAFTSVDKQSVIEGKPLSVLLSVSDPDNHKVTVTIKSKPGDATFDADAKSFTWTPKADTVAPPELTKSVEVTFEATDDGTPPQTATLKVIIEVRGDTDGDGKADNDPAETDADNDGLVDTADPDRFNADTDDDTKKDGEDNCPKDKNTDQADGDKDGKGDVCDACPKDKDNDADQDKKCGDADNCPTVKNDDQADKDGDAVGDVCDGCPNDKDNDSDNDQVCAGGEFLAPKLKGNDNCPTKANPDQKDKDSDSLGDLCDKCPDLSGEDDPDGDGVCGPADNCPNDKNPGQENDDLDKSGDACDPCKGDAVNDPDNDTVCDKVDNCKELANADQANEDKDLLGDLCDTCPKDANNDKDGDTLCADVDNCPDVANVDQKNLDKDTLGDACDPDRDDDTVLNELDNCPDTPNQKQEDLDTDKLGDVCDADRDGDKILNDEDNCPMVPNSDQLDTDKDNSGDACDDNCDNDAKPNTADNCVCVANDDQANLDGDKLGDACDSDVDGDGVPNETDKCKTDKDPNQLDVDVDGTGDVCDDDIKLPKPLLVSGTESIFGDGRNGTYAVVLSEPSSCTGIGDPKCKPPSLFVFEDNGASAISAPSFVSYSGAGGATGPTPISVLVGIDSFTYVTATDNAGTPRLFRAAKGAVTEPIDGTLKSSATLFDGLDGTTWALAPLTTLTALYAMPKDVATKPAEAEVAATFSDAAGTPFVVAADGAVYFVKKKSDGVGSLYTLIAVGAGATLPLPKLLVDEPELFFYGALPDGRVLVCNRKTTSGSPSMRTLKGGALVPGESVGLNPGAGCGSVEVTPSDDKTVWVSFKDTSGKFKLIRWNFATGAKLFDKKDTDHATIWNAGTEVYTEHPCGPSCSSFGWFDVKNDTLVASTTDRTFYFAKVAAQHGQLAFAYTTKQVQPDVMVVHLAGATVSEVKLTQAVPAKAKINGVWLGFDGTAYTLVDYFDQSSPGTLQAYQPPAAPTTLEDQVDQAALLTFPKVSLMRGSGGNKGLLLLSGAGTPVKLDDALSFPAPLIDDGVSLSKGVPQFGYLSASSGFVLAGYSGGLIKMVTGLDGAPNDTMGAAGIGDFVLVQTNGKYSVLQLNGATPTTHLSGLAEAALLRDRAGKPWGALVRVDPAAAYQVCALPSLGTACVTAPTQQLPKLLVAPAPKKAAFTWIDDAGDVHFWRPTFAD